MEQTLCKAKGKGSLTLTLTLAINLTYRSRQTTHEHGAELWRRCGRAGGVCAQEARDATVLIHEATFDDDMEAEAMSKRHSMTKEAVQTGVDARVYRTILTHFSQRYPKIPVWDHSFSARTGVAFDLMAVNFGHLEVTPHPFYTPHNPFGECGPRPAARGAVKKQPSYLSPKY